MDKSLIYDIGFHKGEDTQYYLKKWYNVIAVDANPFLIEAGKKIFFREIASWRLILLNYWITKEWVWNFPFYINKTHTEWSSFDPIAGNRGWWSSIIEIPCISIEKLFERYSTPHYLKCDIEWNDIYVACWLNKENRPFYFSCELCSDDLLEILIWKWYTQFKFIDQRNSWNECVVHFLIPATMFELYKKIKNYLFKTKEYLPWSSWPFWEDTAWKWLNQHEAIIFLQGIRAHSSKIFPTWIDIHAK